MVTPKGSETRKVDPLKSLRSKNSHLLRKLGHLQETKQQEQENLLDRIHFLEAALDVARNRKVEISAEERAAIEKKIDDEYVNALVTSQDAQLEEMAKVTHFKVCASAHKTLAKFNVLGQALLVGSLLFEAPFLTGFLFGGFLIVNLAFHRWARKTFGDIPE